MFPETCWASEDYFHFNFGSFSADMLNFQPGLCAKIMFSVVFCEGWFSTVSFYHLNQFVFNNTCRQFFSCLPPRTGTYEHPEYIPSRNLTYSTWGKRKSSSNMPYQGDMLIPWRVYIYIIYMFIYLDQLTHFPPKQKTSWTSRACHPPYSGLVYLPSVAHHLPASPNEALSISGIGWNSKNTFSTSKRSS